MVAPGAPVPVTTGSEDRIPPAAGGGDHRVGTDRCAAVRHAPAAGDGDAAEGRQAGTAVRPPAAAIVVAALFINRQTAGARVAVLCIGVGHKNTSLWKSAVLWAAGSMDRRTAPVAVYTIRSLRRSGSSSYAAAARLGTCGGPAAKDSGQSFRLAAAGQRRMPASGYPLEILAQTFDDPLFQTGYVGLGDADPVGDLLLGMFGAAQQTEAQLHDLPVAIVQLVDRLQQ